MAAKKAKESGVVSEEAVPTPAPAQEAKGDSAQAQGLAQAHLYAALNYQ